MFIQEPAWLLGNDHNASRLMIGYPRTLFEWQPEVAWKGCRLALLLSPVTEFRVQKLPILPIPSWALATNQDNKCPD